MNEPAEGLSCPAGTPWRLVGVAGRGRFARLQALEDAIAYRQVRSTWPCDACRAAAPGEKCDDHARDLGLIAYYRQAIKLANLDLGSAGRHARPADPLAEPGG